MNNAHSEAIAEADAARRAGTDWTGFLAAGARADARRRAR